jgi:hypothetical protein
MTTYHQIGPGNYWTGETQTLPASAPIPSGWTARPLPEIPEGHYARLTPGGWIVTDRPPPDSDGAIAVAPPEPPEPPAQRVFTHVEFRRLLSFAEQMILDNLDDPEFAAAHPKLVGLDVMQKVAVRTALATYKEAQEINLDDPSTVRFVGLLAQLGLWDDEGRAERILAGEALAEEA